MEQISKISTVYSPVEHEKIPLYLLKKWTFKVPEKAVVPAISLNTNIEKYGCKRPFGEGVYKIV